MNRRRRVGPMKRGSVLYLRGMIGDEIEGDYQVLLDLPARQCV